LLRRIDMGKIYTNTELAEVLEKHLKWRRGEEGGSRANLADANLAGANLTGANLARAYLADAYLADAYLAGANLAGAYLADANLADAYLADANLTGANLAGANLADANLADANLTGANLADANLADANLAGANLAGANLAGAYLADAYLADANLTDANLTDANLTPIRNDFFEILSSVPAEVPGLRLALLEGRIDGSTYTGKCACLVGTIANIKGVEHDSIPGLNPDVDRAAERWFLAIREGHTPENSQVAAITLGWLDEWVVTQAVAPVEA
jgi:hypothetical protein